jgi:dTDP-4-dehydrorhamnose reductase
MIKKKILLTGSNGQLGNSVKSFFNKKYIVQAVSRDYLPAYSKKNLLIILTIFHQI